MTDLVDHFKRRSTPATDVNTVPVGTLILLGEYVDRLDAYIRTYETDKAFTWEYRGGLYTDNDLDEEMSKARYVYVVAPGDIKPVKGGPVTAPWSTNVNQTFVGITK